MAIKKDTYCQQVFDHVTESIRSGEFSPGDKLTEQMLVDRLGISHAPVREALHALTREGLVVTHPHKGRHIKSLSIREITESAFIAGTLEGALAVLAFPEYRKEHFNRLKDLVLQMEKLQSDELSLVRLEKLGNEFHFIVCGQNRLTSFADYTRKLCTNITKLLYYKHWKTMYTPKESAERHKGILDALLSGGTVRIESAIRQHHNEVGKRLSDCLARDEVAATLEPGNQL